MAVSLVAAVGVANLVMSRATLESLQGSRERYYRDGATGIVLAIFCYFLVFFMFRLFW